MDFPPVQPRRRSMSSTSFAPTATVYKVRHINDFSDEEVNSMWYNQDDLNHIKTECELTVQMILEGEPFDSTKYCSRGLEYRTPHGLQRRKWNRHAARDAVFDEQYYVKRKVNCNSLVTRDMETSIACVYRLFSEPSLDAARDQAVHDARYIATSMRLPSCSIQIDNHALPRKILSSNSTCIRKSNSENATPIPRSFQRMVPSATTSLRLPSCSFQIDDYTMPRRILSSRSRWVGKSNSESATSFSKVSQSVAPSAA